MVERLERKLDAALAHERGAARGSGELLSKREAARRLRIDRGTTLEELLRSGRLRAVPALSGKGVRIPSAEVERLQREGLQPGATPAMSAPRKPRRSQRPATGPELERSIRSIPIPGAEED